MKTIATISIALLVATSAFAGSYRVTYTAGGLIQRITVQAESTQEARRTVQNLFPGCCDRRA